MAIAALYAVIGKRIGSTTDEAVDLLSIYTQGNPSQKSVFGGDERRLAVFLTSAEATDCMKQITQAPPYQGNQNSNAFQKVYDISTLSVQTLT